MTDIIGHKNKAMQFQISLYSQDRNTLRYLLGYFNEQGTKTSFSELIRNGIRLLQEAVEKEKLGKISK